MAGGKTSSNFISPAKAAKSRAGSGILFWSLALIIALAFLEPLKSAEMASGVLSINEFESLTRGEKASHDTYQVSIIISPFSCKRAQIKRDKMGFFNEISYQEKLAEFDRFYTSYIFMEITRTIKIVSCFEQAHQV